MRKLILLLSLLFLSGCSAAAVPLILSASAAAAQGVIIWKQGEAAKYYNYDIDTVYRAAKHAAESLNLKINSEDPKDHHMNVGEKDKLKIKLSVADKGITKLAIRVDFMGNKPYAELFYKAVDDNLNIIQFEKGKPAKKRAGLFRRLR